MVDVRIENHGSVVLVVPVTVAAKDWIDEHVQPEGWQWLGNGLAVEPRMVGDLIAGMEAEGLEVQ